jgi:hypothetical protein
MNKKLIIFTLILATVTVVARILPHMPNIAPMAALALFAGVYLPRRWSIAVPMAAMLISDIFIGFYEWQVVVAVYLGFVLTVMLGWQVARKLHPLTALGGSLAGSVIFFVLTNAAVWAFTQMYTPNFAGLIDSYVMAIPFFKFSLVGDLAWTTVFFASYQLVVRYFPKADLRTAALVPAGKAIAA